MQKKQSISGYKPLQACQYPKTFFSLRPASGSAEPDHAGRPHSPSVRVPLDQGWSERLRSFTQSLGSEELDASVLMMPMVGFIEPTDPRMLSTIEAIERHLMNTQGLLYRYRSEDGIEGEEGTFLLCTFWLAHVHALSGHRERAYEAMERCIRYVNDVGLLSEEIEPRSGELIGNFPQAFSHIGLINAAWAIAVAEERQTFSASPRSQS